MTVRDRTYTVDAFWEFISQPDNADKLLELIDGEIVEVAASSAVPSIITVEITLFVGSHVKQHDLGYVTSAEGGFVLSPKNVLMPDMGFIAKERVAKLPERFFPGAPDLAVEVVSPTDRKASVHRKALRYIKYGVRLGWVVYPEQKMVDVYRPAETTKALVQELDIDGTLDGFDVLPGFTLAVRDIFKAVDR
jgi:Uma2 family endonuclease